MDELLLRFRVYCDRLFQLLLLGWQPRWFILEGGILSYYLSSTDVQQGSKGSVKIASCDIIGNYET